MDVRITPRTIPEGKAARVRVFTQATEHGRILASLSIQREAAGSPGIIRDQGPPFVIKETKAGRIRIEDPARQREGFLPVVGRGDSHIRRFEKSRPDRVIVAVTGCGNLLCNAGVEANAMGLRAGIPGFARGGIRVGPDGRGRLIARPRLASALADDGRGAAAASPDAFVITGPLLVARGKPVEPDVREYADLRHLILPAFVEVAPGRRIDFGFDALMADAALARAAALGAPVTLPLVAHVPESDRVKARLKPVPVLAEAIREALRTKGYRESARVTSRGTFRLGRGGVTIAFLEGIYPHHALAVDRNGVVTSVVVSGRSNREGTTIKDLSAALAKAGAAAAILLDNGGDVGLLRRKTASPRSPLAFVVRPAEADRARAWPTRACLIYHASRTSPDE